MCELKAQACLNAASPSIRAASEVKRRADKAVKSAAKTLVDAKASKKHAMKAIKAFGKKRVSNRFGRLGNSRVEVRRLCDGFTMP